MTISFNLAKGTAIGDAVDSVKKLAREELPPSVTAQFQGTAKAFEASLTGLGLLLFMAVLVIYIVLGILYESFIHPITILSGLAVGGFWRAAHAADFSSESGSLWFRGRDHADRHREEKRHHDGGLRGGAREDRAQDRRRSDLRRLPDSIPADHHDDHGGA